MTTELTPLEEYREALRQEQIAYAVSASWETICQIAEARSDSAERFVAAGFGGHCRASARACGRLEDHVREELGRPPVGAGR